MVTPPATDNWYAASCVFSPSSARSHGKIGPWNELTSDAPRRCGAESTPKWEWRSTMLRFK